MLHNFKLFLRACAAGGAAAAISGAATAQEPAQADHPLAFMFGEWRGAATVIGRDGRQIELTQTERVGPMVGGDAVVIEGRGYSEAGELVFNAFAIVSETAPGSGWEIRSYTNGNAGTFPFEPRANGYVWRTPAGPNAETRYTAEFDNGSWRQIGEYVVPGAEPRVIFEMTLTRLGDSDWPAAGAVGPDADRD